MCVRRSAPTIASIFYIFPPTTLPSTCVPPPTSRAQACLLHPAGVRTCPSDTTAAADSSSTTAAAAILTALLIDCLCFMPCRHAAGAHHLMEQSSGRGGGARPKPLYVQQYQLDNNAHLAKRLTACLYTRRQDIPSRRRLSPSHSPLLPLSFPSPTPHGTTYIQRYGLTTPMLPGQALPL